MLNIDDESLLSARPSHIPYGTKSLLKYDAYLLHQKRGDGMSAKLWDLVNYWLDQSIQDTSIKTLVFYRAYFTDYQLIQIADQFKTHNYSVTCCDDGVVVKV